LTKDRGEHPALVEREQDDRELESRESVETKFDEETERESEKRAAAAERLPDQPPPQEENDGD
jgi:hypothetical protein